MKAKILFLADYAVPFWKPVLHTALIKSHLTKAFGKGFDFFTDAKYLAQQRRADDINILLMYSVAHFSHISS